MDFKLLISTILSGIILVGLRTTQLIRSPYKTIRVISQDTNSSQLYVIFVLIYFYFVFADFVKPFNYTPALVYAVFLLNFLLSSVFFYFINVAQENRKDIRPFIMTFTYSLMPSLIWFTINTSLFLIFPPPRTTSPLGTLFSIIFIIFSLGMLFWKVQLVYLSLRFASKTSFVNIVYAVILYLCVFAPYSVLLYYAGIFRIPFI